MKCSVKKYSKQLTILIFFSLTGCYYSDGCLHMPQSVHCVDRGKRYPYIAKFQKRDTVGHTNSNQRWKDATQCGAININYQTNDFDTKGGRNKDGDIIPSEVYIFRACMSNKGYEYIADCGFQTPKWSTGKCNL